jgi:hypothetical protein
MFGGLHSYLLLLVIAGAHQQRDALHLSVRNRVTKVNIYVDESERAPSRIRHCKGVPTVSILLAEPKLIILKHNIFKMSVNCSAFPHLGQRFFDAVGSSVFRFKEYVDLRMVSRYRQASRARDRDG